MKKTFYFQIPLFVALIIFFSFRSRPAEEHSVKFLGEWYFDVKNISDLKKANLRAFDSEFKNCEYRDLLVFSLRDSAKDVELFVKEFKQLKEKLSEITPVAVEALRAANKEIKNDSVKLYFFPCFEEDRELVRQMGGLNGLTVGQKAVVIFIDVQSEGWKKNLPYTIAHEFYHTHWTNRNYTPGTQFTLAEYLVFEGKADAYAHSLYPSVKVPWVSALDGSNKKMQWEKIKSRLSSKELNFHLDVMFGGYEFPQWTGYTMGYDATQKYIEKHPELKPKDWYKISADKIFEGYMP